MISDHHHRGRGFRGNHELCKCITSYQNRGQPIQDKFTGHRSRNYLVEKSATPKFTKALFRLQELEKFGTVALLFVFDNYCPIMA